MNFEEYIKYRFELATNKNMGFNEKGKSPVAICNQSFWFVYKYSCRGVFRDLKELVWHNPIEYVVGGILAFLFFGALFPLTALLRTFFARRNAKKELLSDWQKRIRLMKVDEK